MKWAFCCLLFLCISCADEASVKTPIIKDTNQGPPLRFPKEPANPYAPVDVSPMDITYYPVDYPKLKPTVANKEPLMVRVIYSRPQKQGRKIFGSLVKWGEVWRLGANEATEIQFFKPATIQGKRINPGRYIMYCIPQEKEWTIVFNTDTDRWGLHPDPKKDIQRFTIPVQQSGTIIEFFTMSFIDMEKGTELLMAWDDTVARLPIQF